MSTFDKKMMILAGVLNFIRKKNRTPVERLKVGGLKNIVVINNKRLGDFLFSTPAIRALKESNPSAKIIAVTSMQNSGLIGDNDFIDEFIFMNDSMKDAINVGKKLKKYKPEVGIIFHSKPPYAHVALTIANVNCMLKHYFGNEKKILINVCDSHVIGGQKPPVQNDLELVSPLVNNIINKDMFFPAIVSPKNINGCVIGMQLGASGSNRFFPTEIAAEVICKIHSEFPDCKFELIGAMGESYLGDELLGFLNEGVKGVVTSKIGRTTINQLAETINNFSLLITPDTGALHIATALKTKTVSLFVKRQTNASVPQQDKDMHFVIYASDYPSNDITKKSSSQLTAIPPNEIVSGVINMLKVSNNFG